MNIVVAGVGYVGLVTGLGLAKLGHNIFFLDVDSVKIKKLSNKEAPFFEPELDNFLEDENIISKCTFTSDYNQLPWVDIDIFMICVQTPISDDGVVDTSYLETVFCEIDKFLKPETVVCIKSTIHPDALESIFNSSDLPRERIVFNPEFLREGSAFLNFFEPDRIVIGSNNEKNAKTVASLYEKIESEILYTDPVSSQLIKYLSNTYLPLRLSFVNEASQITKSMGGNLNQVLYGIGLDKRIGSGYFRPSPGWGGSCFPKDVKEIKNIANSRNLDLPLINNIDISNSNHKSWFADKIIEIKNSNRLDRITLIGAAFKEDTDDLRDSPTLHIYSILKSKNEPVEIYDNTVVLDDKYNQISKIFDNSLFVEMYPLGEKLLNILNSNLNDLSKYYYFRYWEEKLDI